MSAKWYVLQTKPHKESLVSYQLENGEGAFPVFSPKIRNHQGVRPLFPSYIFAQCDLDSLKNYQILRYTRGVLRLVGNDQGSVTPVAFEVVKAIQERVTPEGFIEQRSVYRPGQKVRVLQGSLKDLVGTLEKTSSESDRVQVLFKIMKYPFRAMIDYKDISVAVA